MSVLPLERKSRQNVRPYVTLPTFFWHKLSDEKTSNRIASFLLAKTVMIDRLVRLQENT